MTNYYVQLCFVLDLQTEENCKAFKSIIEGYDELQCIDWGFWDNVDSNLSDEEFINKVLEAYKAEQQKEFTYPTDSILLFNDFSDGELINATLAHQSTTKLLFDYQESIPSALDQLIQYAIKRFNLPPVGFCYCFSADRACVDTYTGGACWITKDNIEWFSADNWLEEKRKLYSNE